MSSGVEKSDFLNVDLDDLLQIPVLSPVNTTTPTIDCSADISEPSQHTSSTPVKEKRAKKVSFSLKTPVRKSTRVPRPRKACASF